METVTERQECLSSKLMIGDLTCGTGEVDVISAAVGLWGLLSGLAIIVPATYTRVDSTMFTYRMSRYKTVDDLLTSQEGVLQ